MIDVSRVAALGLLVAFASSAILRGQSPTTVNAVDLVTKPSWWGGSVSSPDEAIQLAGEWAKGVDLGRGLRARCVWKVMGSGFGVSCVVWESEATARSGARAAVDNTAAELAARRSAVMAASWSTDSDFGRMALAEDGRDRSPGGNELAARIAPGGVVSNRYTHESRTYWVALADPRKLEVGAERGHDSTLSEYVARALIHGDLAAGQRESDLIRGALAESCREAIVLEAAARVGRTRDPESAGLVWEFIAKLPVSLEANRLKLALSTCTLAGRELPFLAALSRAESKRESEFAACVAAIRQNGAVEAPIWIHTANGGALLVAASSSPLSPVGERDLLISVGAFLRDAWQEALVVTFGGELGVADVEASREALRAGQRVTSATQSGFIAVEIGADPDPRLDSSTLRIAVPDEPRLDRESAIAAGIVRRALDSKLWPQCSSGALALAIARRELFPKVVWAVIGHSGGWEIDFSKSLDVALSELRAPVAIRIDTSANPELAEGLSLPGGFVSGAKMGQEVSVALSIQPGKTERGEDSGALLSKKPWVRRSGNLVFSVHHQGLTADVVVPVTSQKVFGGGSADAALIAAAREAIEPALDRVEDRVSVLLDSPIAISITSESRLPTRVAETLAHYGEVIVAAPGDDGREKFVSTGAWPYGASGWMRTLELMKMAGWDDFDSSSWEVVNSPRRGD